MNLIPKHFQYGMHVTVIPSHRELWFIRLFQKSSPGEEVQFLPGYGEKASETIRYMFHT